MASTYPGLVDSFATRSNGQLIDASHVQDLENSMVAVESTVWPEELPPSLHGMATWNYDISTATASSLPTAGTVQWAKVILPTTRTITNVCLFLVTNGATLTAGQNFAALYDSAGNKLDVTADQTSVWNTGAPKGLTMALVGGATTRVAGTYLVSWWSNGTTIPAFARNSGAAGIANAFLASSLAGRWGTANTGVTTTAPNPLASVATANIAYWAGLS